MPLEVVQHQACLWQAQRLGSPRQKTERMLINRGYNLCVIFCCFGFARPRGAALCTTIKVIKNKVLRIYSTGQTDNGQPECKFQSRVKEELNKVFFVQGLRVVQGVRRVTSK